RSARRGVRGRARAPGDDVGVSMDAIRTMPIRTGTLTFGGRPDETHFEALRELDIWWNLAHELEDALPRMGELAGEVLFADIDDGATPSDLPLFVEQLDRVCVLLGCGGRVHVSSCAGRGRTGLVLACIRMLLDEEDPATALSAATDACGGPALET